MTAGVPGVDRPAVSADDCLVSLLQRCHASCTHTGSDAGTFAILSTASATRATSCSAVGRADGAHSMQPSQTVQAAACSPWCKGPREQFGCSSNSATDLACAPCVHARKILCPSERGSRFRLPAAQCAGRSSASSAAEGRPLRSTCASSKRAESCAEKSWVPVNASHTARNSRRGWDAPCGGADLSLAARFVRTSANMQPNDQTSTISL